MEITAKLIRRFNACYDPDEIGFTDDLELTPLESIDQFENKVKEKEDILWLLCRKDFMTDRDMRLFAVWCARESFKLTKDIDQRSIDAVNVSEKFANGEAAEEELSAARSAAQSAAESAAWSARSAAGSAAYSAAESAAYSAAYSAAESAAWPAQINQLKTYFK